jgi:glycosyltransferase involved in cell wall biosynthesis
VSEGDPTTFLSRRDRPRVLYLIEQAEYSGAELGQLPVMLADADPLLACPPGSSTENLARSNGIPTVALSHRRIRHSGGRRETLFGVARALASAIELRRVLRAHPERQIVYCLTVRAALIASIASLGTSRRLMWHVTNFLPDGLLGAAIRLIAVARASIAVPHSEVLARDFAGRFGRLRARSRTIHSGCNLERTLPDHVEPGRPRAVIVGDISPTKRTDLAVDVAERVVAERPDFELSIVGRSRYRDEDVELEQRLRERVAANGSLRDRVIFRGRTTHMAAEYADAGLLLHCCPAEPFGIIVLEAMACGLPVVAPAGAGPLETVEHGVTGYLYEPGDADTAAGYVLDLIADRAKAARLGAAGRRRYEERFSLNRMVARTDAVLAELGETL